MQNISKKNPSIQSIQSAQSIQRISKKSQGISFSYLIIGAIMLVVLIVVISIFISKSDKFTENIDDCSSKFANAECRHISECSPLKFGKIGCPQKDYYCCVPDDKTKTIGEKKSNG